MELFKFFYNSSFSAKSWQNPASIDRNEKNKKNCPQWELNQQPPDHYSKCSGNCARQESVGQEVSFVCFMPLHILDFD